MSIVQAMAACPGRTSRSSLPKPPPPKAKPAPKARRAQHGGVRLVVPWFVVFMVMPWVFIVIQWNLMVINEDFMGFYGDLMWFYCDSWGFHGILWRLMVIFHDFLWHIVSGGFPVVYRVISQLFGVVCRYYHITMSYHVFCRMVVGWWSLNHWLRWSYFGRMRLTQLVKPLPGWECMYNDGGIYGLSLSQEISPT